MNTKLILAPLAGFTDAPFRLLCSNFGADKTYTEMVSAAALAHAHVPTNFLMSLLPGETRVGCQIFGANEKDVAFAARVINDKKFCELNLNAGCPMTKVTRCGAGAKLVEEPEKVFRLLLAMKENTSLPITLKTRLGSTKETSRAYELLDAAEKAGAKEIIFHARYTNQCHSGEIDFDSLASIVARAKIPVTGNGSITNVETARRFCETGVSSLMIGRASLAKPSIFFEIKNALFGEGSNFSLPSQIELAEKHLSLVLQFSKQLKGSFPNARVMDEEAFALLKMRTHIFRYFSGVPNAATFRAQLHAAKTLKEIRELFSQAPYLQSKE